MFDSNLVKMNSNRESGGVISMTAHHTTLTNLMLHYLVRWIKYPGQDIALPVRAITDFKKKCLLNQI
jgi:hypothetical protein